MTKKQNLVKYTLKDSIFTSLFSHPEYLLQLYQTLHPEDTEATEDSLTDVTIKNVITYGIHNDLGFMANGKTIHLIEAQSTWSANIVFRELEYLTKTYQDYLSDTSQNKFSHKKISLPRPELYVIYSGEKGDKPNSLNLSDLWIENGPSSIDLEVKIIYYEGEKDIISQYILFTRIYDEQKKIFDNERLAVKETIQICKNEDVLSSYIEKYEREVVDNMLTMYDPEEELREYIRCEVAEGKAEGLAEGMTQGEAKGKDLGELSGKAKSVTALMKKMNIPMNEAMNMLDISDSEAQKISKLVENQV